MSDSKGFPKIELKEGEAKLLLDHNYDGIHELDHVLPRWWIWLLYGTIAFAIGYSGYYLFGPGPTPQQELKVAMEELTALMPKVNPSSGGEEEALLAAFKDPARRAHGAELFQMKCFACHGEKGQGIVGPNLTDDFWIHGKGTLKDIAAVLITGVPEKGMPAWGPALTPEELRDLAVFVHSLHGTNPPGAKAAQGDKQDYKD